MGCDRDELCLDLALALELGVFGSQLRLGLRERAGLLADQLIEVRTQRTKLGARLLDLPGALLEHARESRGGVEQFGLA